MCVLTFTTGRSRVVSSDGSVRGLCDTVHAQVSEQRVEFVNALSSSAFYIRVGALSLPSPNSFVFFSLCFLHDILCFRSFPFSLFSLPHLSLSFSLHVITADLTNHSGLSGIVYKNASK